MNCLKKNLKKFQKKKLMIKKKLKKNAVKVDKFLINYLKILLRIDQLFLHF